MSAVDGTRQCVLGDEQLIRRVAAGDPRALEVIFDRHGSLAYSLAYRILHCQARAEDVVQEAFLSLWRGAASYEPARGSVRTWLLRIVHNRAIDTIRRNAPRDAGAINDEGVADRLPSTELTDEAVMRSDELRRIRAALDDLPPTQRQVIELAFFDGLSHRQIAQLLKLPPGTVKGRMRLGLAKLHGLLESRATWLEQAEEPVTWS